MSEYDPKSIPILDDIIDGEKVDDAELDTEQADPAADDNLDLFSDDSSDDSIEASPVIIEHILNLPETAIHEDNSIDEQVTDEPAVSESVAGESVVDELTVDEVITADAITEDSIDLASDTIESALIDYKSEDDTIEGNQTDEVIVTDESKAQISLQHQVLLEPVVNEIVKQLIPDMEQQLRFLVKQALADWLPDELIKQLVTKDGTEKNTET